jgi:hypothetical protein
MKSVKKSSNRNGRRRLFSPAGPIQFRANPEITRRYRFVSASGATTAINDFNLLLMAGVSATTATVGNCIFQSAKLRNVEIWTPPAAQGAAATCSVLFPVGNQSQPREVSDTTVSTAVPAHLSCGPPANSLASFWNDGSTGLPVMSITAPVGSIIDVIVSLVMGDASTNNNAATLVGATIGQVYYCALDSGTAAGSAYPPVSLTQL